MDASGIYQIRNKINNKLYIGESIRISRRKNDHFQTLSVGKHHNQHLQNAVNEYGIENFDHSILERLDTRDKKILKAKEHEWCLLLNTYSSDYGYNILIDEKKLEGFIENVNRRKEYLVDGVPRNNPIHLIYQIDNHSNIIRVWKNKVEVKEFFNVSEDATEFLIYGAYKKKTNRVKTWRGFVWVYEEDYNKDFDYSIAYKHNSKGRKIRSRAKPLSEQILHKDRNIKKSPVSLQNISTQEIKNFISKLDAAKFLNSPKNTINALERGFKAKGGGKISKITQWKGWKIYILEN